MGYWYDAFSTINEWIGTDSIDADTRHRLERQRAALLLQVQLSEVASQIP
jgi:hypothetical protein